MTETSYAGARSDDAHQQSTTEGLKETAQQVAGQVGGKARDLREQVGERTKEQVNERSTQMGEQMTDIAQALRRTGGQLREEGKSQPAGLAEGVADRVERLGDYLRDADADRILNDVEDFARRQPWVVGFGSAVVGVVASRVLKASSSRRYEGRNGDFSSPARREPREYAELPVGSMSGSGVTPEPVGRSGDGV